MSLGDTLTYRFVARNDSDVTLTDVTITDPMTGLSALTCDQAQPATPAPDVLLTCTVAYVVMPEDVDAGPLLYSTADGGFMLGLVNYTELTLRI